MTTLSLTDPVNSTTADANLIASNNTAIRAVINGNLDNTNISANAAIAIAKLATGTTGLILGADPATGAPSYVGGMQRIYDSTLGSVAASFDVSSISSVFAHLRIYASCRGASASPGPLLLRINNDSGASAYNWQRMFGNGAGAGGSESIGTSSIYLSDGIGSGSPASTFQPVVIDISNYAAATRKTTISTGGAPINDVSTGLPLFTVHGVWKTAAALNRITVLYTTGNVDTGSRLTIYGIS